MSEVRVMSFLSSRWQSCIFIIFFGGKRESLRPVRGIFILFTSVNPQSMFSPYFSEEEGEEGFY